MYIFTTFLCNKQNTLLSVLYFQQMDVFLSLHTPINN